ncbi:dihydrofolate reductase family protein [Larkinella soli]|uniref:dihydrofolate reductase family protein n=1 Tax=Larkinella soli TaxID=1770527 RepID=UPI000FFBE2AD|nr:dihydrofolate reductase family protein [Larkinella soli]
MRKIVYHVASTLDGYIGNEDGSVDKGFVPEGEHVTEYLESLKSYDTVIMGKATYEFGYQYGMQPGQPPYPWMKHYIFSKTLHFETPPDERVEIIDRDELAFLRQLKAGEGTDIYLCGGGAFAAFLLENELIDQLIVKLNPALLGSGIRLFGTSKKYVDLTLLDSKPYDTGVLLLTYQIRYQ